MEAPLYIGLARCAVNKHSGSPMAGRRERPDEPLGGFVLDRATTNVPITDTHKAFAKLLGSTLFPVKLGGTIYKEISQRLDVKDYCTNVQNLPLEQRYHHAVVHFRKMAAYADAGWENLRRFLIKHKDIRPLFTIMASEVHKEVFVQDEDHFRSAMKELNSLASRTYPTSKEYKFPADFCVSGGKMRGFIAHLGRQVGHYKQGSHMTNCTLTLGGALTPQEEKEEKRRKLTVEIADNQPKAEFKHYEKALEAVINTDRWFGCALDVTFVYSLVEWPSAYKIVDPEPCAQAMYFRHICTGLGVDGTGVPYSYAAAMIAILMGNYIELTPTEEPDDVPTTKAGPAQTEKADDDDALNESLGSISLGDDELNDSIASVEIDPIGPRHKMIAFLARASGPPYFSFFETLLAILIHTQEGTTAPPPPIREWFEARLARNDPLLTDGWIESPGFALVQNTGGAVCAVQAAFTDHIVVI